MIHNKSTFLAILTFLNWWQWKLLQYHTITFSLCCYHQMLYSINFFREAYDQSLTKRKQADKKIEQNKLL